MWSVQRPACNTTENYIEGMHMMSQDAGVLTVTPTEWQKRFLTGSVAIMKYIQQKRGQYGFTKCCF